MGRSGSSRGAGSSSEIGNGAALAGVGFWAQAALFLAAIPVIMFRFVARIDVPWQVSAFHMPGVRLASSSAGALISALGAYVAIRAWMCLSLVGASPLGQAPRVLVTRGIYRFVMNPMYWGYTVFWLGMTVRLRSAAMLAASAVVGAGLALWSLAVERPALRRRFGAEYIEYERHTPSILPTWKVLFYDWRDFPMIRMLVAFVLRIVARALWRVDVKGIQHVPRKGPGVIVSNHVMYLDPFLINMFATASTRYVASDELFRKPFTRWFFRAMGAISKKRWSRDIGVLRQIRSALNRGELVGIFPEGGRNWDGAPVPVGDEVYRLLMHLDAPVTCVSLHGAHEAWPRWCRWPSVCNVTVEFFEPLRPSDFETVERFRHEVERRIFACADDEPQPRKGVPARGPSHVGITTVAWGCLRCGAPMSLGHTDAGLECRSCGASYTVTPALEVVDDATGRRMLERDYRAALLERLRAGRMLDAPGGEFNVDCQADVYSIRSTRELVPLARGALRLTRSGLHFSGRAAPRKGERGERRKGEPFELDCAVEDIDFTYLNLANHLVVVSRGRALQFHIKGDSPVRWEDYLLTARGSAVRQWRSGEQVRRRAKANGGGVDPA